MLIKAEGIIIKSINYGEGSKIITLYTRNLGKISIMVKGAKKPNSRFHAVTQIFSYGQFIFYMGKEMGNLNQGDLEQNFIDIISSLEKTAYAAYITELVDKLTEPKEANPYLFQQLLSSFEHLNAGKDEEIIARIFEIKIFQIAGYKPNLSFCSICDKDSELTAFSIPNGGLICSQHPEIKAISLQSATIKLLRLFERIDISRLGKIEVKNSTKYQLHQVMRAFYDEYIGIPLKSRNFLDQMKKI